MSFTKTLIGQIESRVNAKDLPLTAVLTCDIEADYGHRLNTKELLEEGKYINGLLDFCDQHKTPLSSFVVTSCLSNILPCISILKERKADVHAHSHSHDTARYSQNSVAEIKQAQDSFKKFFGQSSLGYRAPQGVLMPDDPTALVTAGYKFDASIFPACRRGVFDYRNLPTEPWWWQGGVVELPFAALKTSRRRITLSTLKLRGLNYWQRALKNTAEWPRVFVIDTHLHDLFTPSSFNRLPWAIRLAYSRNREQGFNYLEWLIKQLKEQGYHFATMTELYRSVADR